MQYGQTLIGSVSPDSRRYRQHISPHHNATYMTLPVYQQGYTKQYCVLRC